MNGIFIAIKPGDKRLFGDNNKHQLYYITINIIFISLCTAVSLINHVSFDWPVAYQIFDS